MNAQLEEKFVKSCIVRDKRERMLFELQGKRRRDAIGRFCHNADDIIMKSAVLEAGNDISGAICSRVKMAKDRQCYVISYYEDMDGCSMDKDMALEKTIGRGMPSVLVFSDFCIVETEQDIGASVKYILKL